MTPYLVTPKPLHRRLLWVPWPECLQGPLIPPGHIPVLCLSSWPRGVPTESLSWEPHFLQLFRYSDTQEGEAAPSSHVSFPLLVVVTLVQAQLPRLL